jgi:hypothetical protein
MTSLQVARGPDPNLHCSLCAQRCSDHRGRITAVTGSQWGIRSETMGLCADHMAVVALALYDHAVKYGLQPPSGMFSVAAWMDPAEIRHCELCGKPFPWATHGASRIPIPEFDQLWLCDPCLLSPMEVLLERCLRTYKSACKQKVELTRQGLIAHLQSGGKHPWTT